MFAQKKAVTADEFERMVSQSPYNNGLYELINNGVVQKMPTEEHGEIAANLVTELTLYKRRMGKGRVGVEVLHRIPGDPNNARQPDVSFTVDADEPTIKRGAVPHLPDLAIEIQSPSNTVKEMRSKADYYLAHGAKMVWIVYAEVQAVEIVTEADVVLLSTHNTLTGGDLLPDFSIPVAQIFA